MRATQTTNQIEWEWSQLDENDNEVEKFTLIEVTFEVESGYCSEWDGGCPDSFECDWEVIEGDELDEDAICEFEFYLNNNLETIYDESE